MEAPFAEGNHKVVEFYEKLYPKDVWRNEGYSVLDRFSLKGKKAFVTGASGGIGRNAAAVFAQAGADVVISDIERTRATLDLLAVELAERFGTVVVPAYCDVSDEAQVTATGELLEERLGTVDVAFLNAGVVLPGDDYDESFETWKRTIDIDLHGMFLCGQMAQKMMRRHGHGGSIIMTSSISAYIFNHMAGNPNPIVAYAAAKAGVSQYARALAAFGVRDGIRVNTIAPGYVWSGIHEGLMDEQAHEVANREIPMRRFGRTDELHGPLLFLASDASSYVTGINIPVDGGYLIA